jgi:hypothetical protein
VYDTCCRELVAQFVGGYNTLLFAYGQAGTGKTFTLLGPLPSQDGSHNDTRGMFPRACDDVFATMDSQPAVVWSLHASAMEFCMMGCCDLLADGMPVTLGSDHTPVGLKTQRLRTVEDVRILLTRVQQQRATVARRLVGDVAGSTRSHTALILTLRQLDASSGKYCKSTFDCVELAGVQRPDKSGVERLTAVDALVMATDGRNPAGGQSAVTNYELSMLRTQLVRNEFGSVRDRQLVPPVVDYLISLLVGKRKSLVSAVICLSSASQNGWESWFSCTCGHDFSRVSTSLVPEKSHDAAKYATEIAKRATEAEQKMRDTPEDGPGSKFYLLRRATAQDLRNEANIFRQLLQAAV